ncbi:hypothetical protein PTNB73_05604 [Pyrenophora teres f. teres]|uniref:Uncharacterized protein n=1 Tax=Pyrenophora teres f. teres TaxID=97479 RepID=A0A6S6WKK1_9PLEO|nr:hypothetical protein PTNB85_08459 [Pyrenophora teres f. teres]KAE8830433.1 hypothetical protein HRS9139_07057 [Pyrenophora teres f. teres]KAE8841231.1 hypothetical protein HRS9122_05357 [Pyrenophora teres f. teres]KAE8864716.1 hypothetical protein PTNB73_05604 [Pyrenophora teres f. teres]CAE7203015.1 hypothetical protein PTTW11_09159 [Pyrenophora teres f. teres]
MAVLSRIVTMLFLVTPFVPAAATPVTPSIPEGSSGCFDPCISSFGYRAGAPCQKVCSVPGKVQLVFDGTCSAFPNGLCV